MTDMFFARQPIFDIELNTWAYQLRFRHGPADIFIEKPTQDQARKTLASAPLMDLSKLTGGKRAFFAITREILIGEFATLFPSRLVGLELPGDIEPTEATLRAAGNLKKAGYSIGVGAWALESGFRPYLQLADMIRFDLNEIPIKQAKSVIASLQGVRARLLAENVEEEDDYKAAVDAGFNLVEGRFFAKPKIISARDVPGFKMNFLAILKEIHEPEISFEKLDEVIRRDLSLSYKLLKYINSAHFGLSSEITSIHQALVMMGEEEFKKWVSLVVLGGLAADRPPEVVMQAMIRARFCEELASAAGRKDLRNQCFLAGMFSPLDVILGRPLQEIIENIPLAQPIKDCLLGEENDIAHALDLVRAYECLDWPVFDEKLEHLGVKEQTIPAYYLEAVDWSNQSIRVIGRHG